MRWQRFLVVAGLVTLVGCGTADDVEPIEAPVVDTAEITVPKTPVDTGDAEVEEEIPAIVGSWGLVDIQFEEPVDGKEDIEITGVLDVDAQGALDLEFTLADEDNLLRVTLTGDGEDLDAQVVPFDVNGLVVTVVSNPPQKMVTPAFGDVFCELVPSNNDAMVCLAELIGQVDDGGKIEEQEQALLAALVRLP